MTTEKQLWTDYANRITQCLGEIDTCRKDCNHSLVFEDNFAIAESALNQALLSAIKHIGMVEYYGLDSEPEPPTEDA